MGTTTLETGCQASHDIEDHPREPERATRAPVHAEKDDFEQRRQQQRERLIRRYQAAVRIQAAVRGSVDRREVAARWNIVRKRVWHFEEDVVDAVNSTKDATQVLDTILVEDGHVKRVRRSIEEQQNTVPTAEALSPLSRTSAFLPPSLLRHSRCSKKAETPRSDELPFSGRWQTRWYMDAQTNSLALEFVPAGNSVNCGAKSSSESRLRKPRKSSSWVRSILQCASASRVSDET